MAATRATEADGLIADIGGTNARLALVDADGGIHQPMTFETAAHAGPRPLIEAYLAAIGAARAPRRAAVAVACPVTGDRVRLTNLTDWHFSIERLRRDAGLERLDVVNDFAALAHALPVLAPEHLVVLHEGAAGEGSETGQRVVFGPGTGVGVAALAPGRSAGVAGVAVTSEGGHATLPAETDDEADLIARMRRRVAHVSVERVLAGPGLELIHAVVRERAGLPPDPVGAAGLAERAAAGDESAEAALAQWVRFLGSVAGNLALTFEARGGVYIAGGIAPHHVDRLRGPDFAERFVAKGRFRDYLSRVPVRLVTAPTPAFVGLASLLRAE